MGFCAYDGRRMFDAANFGILQKLANAATALVPGLGAKPAQPGTALAASSAVQSERIRLRVLRTNGQLHDIAAAAQSADAVEVLRAAMRELRLAAETDRESVLSILIRLAETDSPCALMAITTLLNLEAFTQANQIFRAKVLSGDIFKVIQGLGSRLFQVIDIACCLDRLFRTNDAPVLFGTLIEALRPPQQALAIAEIMGDSEPGGYRYLHDQNDISSEVKELALQILPRLPFGPARERALWYATRERDDVISYKATVQLIEHWQSAGKVPPHLEPFPMLDIGLLFYLSTLAANFRWRSDVVLADLEDEGQIQREVDARLAVLQPIVNEITKALHLPFATLQASDDVSFAAYGLGTGIVYINKRTILDDRPLGEDVMSSLLHELHHMGQDVLLIRKICDDLDVKFGLHGPKLIAIWDRYSDILGYAPDHLFLLAVLRTRGDRLLPPTELERTTRLVAAASQSMTNHQQAKYIAARSDRLAQSYGMLTTGDLDGQLFSTLRDLSQLQGMFNEGRIPEVLVFELQNCRAELEEVVRPFATDPKLARDPIALAELIYQTEFAPYVKPIAVKIRQVLMETLEEEYQALDRIEARVVRTGYHEDEAYTVSDRVEVIVRAILKGWYASAA